MPQPSLDAEVSFLSDGDSSSSDSLDSSYHPYVNQEWVFSSVNQCKESEDQNASQQRRKLLEGQSSRTGALSTHVEQRAYNLRPRKDDLVTIQRRSKFARLRQKQQNQRRNKRQQEIRDHEDFMHNLFWIAEKEPAKTSDQDFENRIEVITDGTRAKMGVEWSHYFEASDNGLFTTTLKGADWKVEKMALQAGPSVVGLQSFTGDTYLFSCSGTIVEFFEESTMIVTVANLVKCPDAVEVANNLKVEVGGPLMDFDGNFIGMNYYHAKETPFVPSFIVLKCLQQFKLFGYAFDCSCFT
nr:unnamed protein product [Digitaria exilis]